jgi:hypothetical protein
VNDTETKAQALFGDHAAAAMVPLEAVMAAAAHTFDMLDVDQQVELIEEAVERMKASRAIAQASEDPKVVIRSGDTSVVYMNVRDQMRDDLIYQLMHHRFDAVYAIAVRQSDAPEGPEHHEWIFFSRRPTEDEVPRDRTVTLLERFIEAMRRGRQRFESMRASVVRVK